jgi:hypothetical protein
MEELRPDPAATSTPGVPASPTAPASLGAPASHNEPAPSSAGSDDNSKPGRAERIKSRSEAATALFKATLFAMAILFVSVLSCVAVWRHLNSRVLVVEVSAEAQKTLIALGTDIDLRLALRDALNERIAGVQQIVAVQGLAFAGDGGQADISFKPFGLDLSTDEITGIVDHVFDRPPRPTVRLELRCAPHACNDPEAHNATLVMNFSGPSGTRHTSYPVVLGNRALARSLHQSIERIADLVLEQSEPLSSSVLFLNRSVTQDRYPDQFLPDLIRAEGAAVTGRKPGTAGCLADLVIGGSLLDRADLAAGVEAEERAANTGNRACKIHAETNIIFMLTTFALCNPYEPNRRYAGQQMAQAKIRLAALREKEGNIDDLIYFRIPAANLDTDIVETLEKAGTAPQQPACLYTLAPQSIAGNNTTAERLKELLTHSQGLLSSKVPALMQHQNLNGFWLAMRAGVPRSDIAGRLSLSRPLMAAIRKAEVNDAHPRALFVLEGKLAMEIAHASFDAVDRKPNDALQAPWAHELESDEVYTQSKPSMILAAAIDRNIMTSSVAFENASGTTASAPLVEPISDVEVLRLLGDTYYAVGQTAPARIAYAQSVEKFIEANEPVEGVIEVTDTLSRWATVLIETGGCGKDASPDPIWAEKWSRLGDAAPDVCRLIQLDDGTQKPLLATMQKLIRRRLTDCNVAPVPPAAEKDWIASFRHRWEMLECYDRKALIDPQTLPLSAETIDAEIGNALAGLRDL